MQSWTYLLNNNGRRDLKDNICWEEDESNDVLLVISNIFLLESQILLRIDNR